MAAASGVTHGGPAWLCGAVGGGKLGGGTVVIVMGLLLVSGQFPRRPQLFNFLPLLG